MNKPSYHNFALMLTLNKTMLPGGPVWRSHRRIQRVPRSDDLLDTLLPSSVRPSGHRIRYKIYFLIINFIIIYNKEYVDMYLKKYKKDILFDAYNVIFHSPCSKIYEKVEYFMS